MGAKEFVEVINHILPNIKFILAIIFVFGAVIFIHEFGHFITAKIFGVKVEEFALGMGPKILGFKYGETEYKLCALPIGGYVKMSGEEPEEALKKELTQKDYYGQPPYKRFLITFAGPFMNFVLAFFIFIIVYNAGITDAKPIIGPIEKDSPAEKYGLKPNDLIISINGKNVKSFSDVSNIITKSTGKITIKIKRNFSIKTFEIPVQTKETENIFGEKIKYSYIGIGPYIEPVISGVLKESPAKLAKLKKGDKILQIDGIKIKYFQDIYSALNESKEDITSPQYKIFEKIWNTNIKNPEEKVIIPEITFKRNNKIFKKAVVIHTFKSKSPIPSKKDKTQFFWVLGIKPPAETIKYGFWESIGKSYEKIVNITIMMIKVIKMMITGKLGTKALGGPVIIGKMIKKTSEYGIIPLLTLTAFLSINLGAINYFPFPPLDGSHMMFSVIESIRKKPLSLKTMEYIQKTGFAILLTLLLFITYHDILRVVGGE